METKKVQQKTPEQLIKVLSSLQDIFEKNVTKQDLYELGQGLVGLIKEIQKSLDVKVAGNVQTIKSETNRLEREMASFEGKLASLADEKASKVMHELSGKINELSSLVGYLEDNFENYDDSEMREKFESILTTIPEPYDPTEVFEAVKRLEERIRELEEKIITVGRVGGSINNTRVRQALMDTIKTEQPVGDIDGINATYTVSDDIFVVLSVSLNGETIAQLPNYTINGRTIVFSTPLPAVYSGKDWEIKYV